VSAPSARQVQAIARRLDAGVRLLAAEGDLRSVEVDSKGDRVDVVIRLRIPLGRPSVEAGEERRPAKRSAAP
jgi:hypothetical protein